MGQKTAARTRGLFKTGRHLGMRRSVPWFLAALMLMRAMIPAGFMPDLSGAGQSRFEIIICIAEGSPAITADQADAASPAHVPRRGERRFDPCAFALAMAGALVVLGLILALFSDGPSRIFFPFSFERIAFACRSGSLGPRAPPIP